MFPASEKKFLKINLISIITLFTLILAGGIVRSSGSGMGCPDWPKCFNQYIPPTNVAQLPANYKEQYVQGRITKNQKFANILDALGFKLFANEIRDDVSILEPEEFNAAKTWIEYANRLVGAVYGLLLIACLIASLTYIRSRKKIFLLSLFNLFLVGFQGWLGSIVVSTNLLAWVVTIHMLIAV
ncbi:MAG: COX15/CtaA family protein, partial [Flavobacterium sp.]|nr:COX15/CtaA family protein [Pedobacter sp.]